MAQKTYIRISGLVRVCVLRVAQWRGFAPFHEFRQWEGVSAEHVAVFETWWRQTRDVFGPEVAALRHDLIEGSIHVRRVPEHDGIDERAERSKLILLAFTVALAQLATLFGPVTS